MVEETSEQEAKRFCECGCGEQIIAGLTIHGKQRQFKNHHNLRTKELRTALVKNLPREERHYLWKGGRKLSQSGYVMVQAKGHPRATKEGYVFEHILVMEKLLGRYLNKDEVVHHKNKIRIDNRPENLQLFSSNSKHISFELKKNVSDRICCDCGSNTTYIKRSHNPNRSDYAMWYRAENNKFRCRRCQRKRG